MSKKNKEIEETPVIEIQEVTKKATKRVIPKLNVDMISGQEAVVVRVIPSPFKSTNIKLKRAQAQINSAGFAVKNQDGNISTIDRDLDEAVQIPGTQKKIGPPLTINGLQTGLNVIVDNPYAEETAYFPSWGENVLKGKEKALLAHVLAYNHNKADNYYSAEHFDQINPSTSIANLPFFLKPESKIPMDGNVMFLHMNNQLHEVWYYVLRAHPICANSYEDLDEGRNINAFYYLSVDEDVVDAKLDKIKDQMKAGAILTEMFENDNAIISYALVLGMTDRNISKKSALAYLHQYFGSKQKANKEKFMRMYDMFKDAARRDHFFGLAIAQDLVNHNIIRFRDNKYYWMKPSTSDSDQRMFEWPSMDNIVREFILNEAYTVEYDIMKAVLKNRKGH
jgi:hypothetical protein